MADIKIEGKEIKYAIGGVSLIMIWFLFVRPAIAPFLQTLPPIFSMLIFQAGLLGGLLLLSTLLNGHAFHIKFSIITFIILLGVNILTPPYLVAQNGTIHTEVEYWYVSTDAAFGSLYTSIPFIPASWIWYLVYIFTPIILMVVIPVIITSPNVIRKTIQGGA
jgi:hypothetical protein